MKSILRKSMVALLALSMILTSLGTLGFTASAAVNNNLLVNGDFENGTTGFSTSGTTTFEVIADPDNAANHVLHVVGGASGGGYHQVVTVEKNTDYVFTFRMKDLNNTGGTKINVHPDGAWNSLITSIEEDSADAYSALADGVATVATYNQSWQTFTVKFNSGENTAVKLWHNMWASNREVYMDDWTLYKVPQTNELLNGDFSLGTTGYTQSATTTFEVITEPDNTSNKVLHVVGGGNYYQIVSVEPNTEYTWTFRMKDLGNAGGTKINVHPDGAWNSLITSIEEDSADAYSALADGVATVATYNQTWQTFTVKFNSGDNTIVKLWHNMWANTREVYMDDWTLSNENSIPEEPETDIESLLQNGSFINGTTGYSNSGTGTFEVIEEPEKTSNHVLHVVGGASGGGYWQTVAVEPYKNYVWTFRMKDLGNIGGTKICVHPENAWNSIITSITEDSAQAYSALADGVATVATYDTTWQTFTVKFNSGNNTAVKLWHNMWASTREVYMDDWTLFEIPLLNNADFESETVAEGFYVENITTAIETTEVQNGSQSLKLDSTGTWENARLYKDVEVVPNTDYTWTFWYKSYTPGKVSYVGVRTTDGTNLLPSFIRSTGTIIDNPSFNSVRPAAGCAANWHATLVTESWNKYSVTFNSGDNTVVLLTVNMHASGRGGYIDNWDLSAASGSSAPEYEPKINGVSIVAGTDTTVNYYSYYGKNYSMKFTMNKKETVVEGYYDASKSMYVYQFKGVTPERFGDNIKAELMLNGEVVTLKETFSVLDYLKTVSSKTADDLGLSETKYAKLKAVANDMLHYGAAAQKYFGYKTSSLVNEGITEGTEFVAPTKNDKDVTNKSADGVTFTGQNLYFDNVNSLMFRFTVDEQVITDITKLSIKISDGTETKIITSEDFEKIAENTYVVYSNDIYATEFDTVFTATACVDGKDGANVKYSVNSYVYAMCNKSGIDADMLELAKATYNYGISAKAYAEAK